MKRIFRCSSYVLSAALIFLLATGCDSNDTGAGGDVSEESLREMNLMMTEVFTVLDEITLELEGQNPTKASTMPTYECESGGSVDFEVAESETELDWTLEFNDCDGIDGNLDFGFLTSEPDENTFVSEFFMDGELNERCTLSYNNWRQRTNFSFDQEANEITGTVVYDGGMSATCGDDSFSCTFDEVTLNFDDDEVSGLGVYEANCR